MEARATRYAARADAHRRWHRARIALRHSLRVRLVVLFLLLALATTVVFMGGMQKMFSAGWRDAARPLLSDYVSRLADEIGSPPSVERAQALAARLPVSIRISGPQVNWATPVPPGGPWRDRIEDGNAHDTEALLQRMTPDGHRIQFGLAVSVWQNQPRGIVWATLGVLLLFTAFAFMYIRRLLRPLDDIRAGAQRFGAGNFDQPIPIRHRDELGVLAGDINTMAHDIHQMLEAKRALLLAISHELRSPLTRARVNTELLPETGEASVQRAALLRDLSEMRDLVTDLLESERLGEGHAALHVEPTDLPQLAREVIASLPAGRATPSLAVDDNVPTLSLDRTRMKLLMRNLLDNALRHSADASQPPELRIEVDGKAVQLTVRDWGPGVDEAALPHLAEPFYRPDESRERSKGGVGLGLYLCKLVARAHAASWSVKNATPGLEIVLRFDIV